MGPAKLVLAVPVAPPETIAAMGGEADQIVCLEAPEYFVALGEFYDDFSQTGDGEVIKLLEAASRRSASAPGHVPDSHRPGRRRAV